MRFWFYSEKAKEAAKYASISAMILTPILVLMNEFLPKIETILPSINSFITNGIVPLIILLLVLWFYYKYVFKEIPTLPYRKSTDNVHIYNNSFHHFDFDWNFFRGVDMKLDFPWNV